DSPIDSGGDGEIMDKPKAKKMKGTGKFMYGKWDSQDEEEENGIEENKVKKEEESEGDEDEIQGLAIEGGDANNEGFIGGVDHWWMN
ncbi:hypothetical protein PENTCL1PPCAC_26732, partial [Pristionchus entomophagus]